MGATVLVVDDSEAMRKQTRRILEESGLGLTVIEAVDGVEALPLALAGDVQLVVSDIVMPRLDGVQLLRSIRQQRDWDSLPVILVTSHAESAARGLSFEAGANDYVDRPFTAEELIGRIRVQLRLMGLRDELARAEERHRRLGAFDESTGLANRRHLFDLARRELSRARRHKLAMSIAVVAIDDWQGVAVRGGHLATEALLADVATALSRSLRTADVLARLGPERFGALLAHTDATQARVAGERLCAAVRGATLPGHAPGAVTVSVGTSSYPSGPLESVDELVNAAEASLDRIRGRGGNRVECWSEALA